MTSRYFLGCALVGIGMAACLGEYISVPTALGAVAFIIVGGVFIWAGLSPPADRD